MVPELLFVIDRFVDFKLLSESISLLNEIGKQNLQIKI